MDLIESLLQDTSRTFALSIPLLPERLRREVAVAYLLFRIADTIEDELDARAEDRLHAMHELCAAADEPGHVNGPLSDALSRIGKPEDHEGYAMLLENAALVLGTLNDLDPAAADLIATHLTRTCRGMSLYIASDEPLTTMEHLRDYCYVVAGIVGELCTDLFVNAEPALEPAAQHLRELAPAFGEALQLVNILRDEHADAAEGRRYLPQHIAREDIARIAAEDLDKATEYVETLERHNASPALVAFNALNPLLAIRTLALVNAHGPGVKVSREDVTAAHAEVLGATMNGQAVSPILRRAAQGEGLAP